VPAERRSVRRTSLGPAATVQCGLVVAIVVWGTLSFGAVYPWGYRPLAGAALVAGAIGLIAGDRRRRAPVAVIAALACLVAAILLQTIPLERDLLARISPASVALLAQYEVGFAIPGASAKHAVSIDPLRTFTALALVVSLGTFLLGLTAMIGERMILRIVRSVVVLGVLIAVVGMVSLASASASGKVLGLWQPQSAAQPFGPFVNRNHYAGWMLMSIPLGVGYFISLLVPQIGMGARSWRDRVMWFSTPSANGVFLVGSALTVMTLSVMMSLSRSGIVCLTLGLIGLGSFASRKLLGRSRGTLAALSLALATTGCVGWVGTDKIGARFTEFNTEGLGGRSYVWREAGAIARAFPLAGTGLDTFGAAMLVYQTKHLEELYAEAHNDYLQIAAEGGLLVGLPAVALMLLSAREMRRRFQEQRDSVTLYWIRAGAVTGLLTIALQETSEFSLQMPGNAALLCVLAAIALHRPNRSHSVTPRLVTSV
jgi:O-antigen ligase